MLAQVAGRIFWMSRYLERSESIARIVYAYSQLIMDLPMLESLSGVRY